MQISYTIPIINKTIYSIVIKTIIAIGTTNRPPIKPEIIAIQYKNKSNGDKIFTPL